MIYNREKKKERKKFSNRGTLEQSIIYKIIKSLNLGNIMILLSKILFLMVYVLFS